MAKAYLLCRFRKPSTDTPVSPFHLGGRGDQYPRIDRFCIASQQATSMTDGIYAEILSMEGNSFSDAREKLLDLITGHPYWSWLAPFLQE